MLQEISASELNKKCRRCIRVSVSELEILSNVLIKKGYDYAVISDDTAEIYEKIDITSFVLELARQDCRVTNIQEQEETLENYYINLTGGKGNE